MLGASLVVHRLVGVTLAPRTCKVTPLASAKIILNIYFWMPAWWWQSCASCTWANWQRNTTIALRMPYARLNDYSITNHSKLFFIMNLTS